MHIFLILFLFSTASVLAQRQKIDPISFGNVKLAEDRMPVDLKSFEIKNEGKHNFDAALVKDSLQWIRLNQVLLVPRALIDVNFKAPPGHQFSWEYAQTKIIPQYDAVSGSYSARMFISLFESHSLNLYQAEKLVNTLRILPRARANSKLVDYSCAPYSVEIDGAINDFVSLGCKVQRTGKFGDEKPYLEVFLTSASYRLKDQSDPPYLIAFHQSGESKIILQNFEGKEEVITIKAKLPEQLSRLHLAAGLGPYTLETKGRSGNRSFQVAPTAMLYGNLTLNETSSFRFFDSYSRNVSTFHNWGAYYAWELAEFCDQRCLLTSLIGVQGVEFRFNSNEASVSETIFPQGFEFIYRHPFGKLNYIFSYGMFASLSGQYDYQNIWMRYGKRVFWEVNFIGWQGSSRSATMFGLSLGFPIGSFF